MVLKLIDSITTTPYNKFKNQKYRITNFGEHYTQSLFMSVGRLIYVDLSDIESIKRAIE